MNISDFKTAKISYNPVNGFVVILDALGIKTLTSDEVSKFMEQRRFVLNILNETLPRLFNRWKSELSDHELPKLLTLGDTFLILFPLKDLSNVNSIQSFQEFSSALGYILSLSLISGLKLRGAISYGEFYYDNDVVIGPAVADASIWYEQSEFIGLISTPETSKILIQLLASNVNGEQLGQKVDEVVYACTKMYWPLYNVPIKGNTHQKILCLNWPYQMVILGPEITNFTGEHVSSFFCKLLHTTKKPPKAQIKYDNTLHFYNYCISYIVEIEARYWTLKVQRAMDSDTSEDWIKSFLEKYVKPNT